MEQEAPGLMTEAERFLILSNIDRLWKEHLQALKFVQQAVGLRGYAQRDPLIEYKLEGYNLFLDMMAQIRRNVIYSIYQVYTKPNMEKYEIPSVFHCQFFKCFFDISLMLVILLFVFLCQFQPVLVKKDQEQSQNEKAAKLVTNGRGGKKKASPANVAESSSAASPQASA